MEFHIKFPCAKTPLPPGDTWVADGNDWPLYEGDLIGDRKGLERLRDAIDLALASDEGRAEFQRYWCDVRIVYEHPDIEKFRTGKLRRFIGNLVGLGVFLFFIFCAFYGCRQLLK